MKFDIEKQKIIDDAFAQELKHNSLLLLDYSEYYQDIGHKINIQRLKLSSYKLGLDLSSQQCYYIWRKFSESKGTNRIMSVPAEEDDRTPLLDQAIHLYLNS